MVSPADAIKINCRNLGYKLNNINNNFSTIPIKISIVALAILGGVGAAYIGLAGGYAFALSTASIDLYFQKDQSEKYPICILAGAVAAYAQNALLGYGIGLLAFCAIRSLADSALFYFDSRNQELDTINKSLLFPHFPNYLVEINTPPSSQNYLQLYQEYLKAEQEGNGPEANQIRTINSDQIAYLADLCEKQFKLEGYHTRNFIRASSAVAAIAVTILTGSPIGLGIVLITNPILRVYEQRRNQKFKVISETFRMIRFQDYIKNFVRVNGASLIYLEGNIARIYDEYVQSISQQRPAEEFVGPQFGEQNDLPPLDLPPGDDNHPSWSAAE